MDPNLVRQSKAIKRYTKKDGTVVEKEYVQTYVVKDNTNKITKTKIIEKVRNATPEQLRQVNEILK